MYLEPINPAPRVYQAERELGNSLRLGLILMVVLVLGLGGLAAVLPIAGAVIAHGEVSVQSYSKKIGHPTGGVISDVPVRDGDRVRAGQVLMRLDRTVSEASATMTTEGVDQLLGQEARLLAERDDLPSVPFPQALTGRAKEPDVASILAEEQRQFDLRRQSRASQIAQLSDRIRQTRLEIADYGAQATALRKQTELVDEELAAQRELWEKRYTTLARLNALERSAVSFRGNEASAHSGAARSRALISEIREQILSLQQEARTDAGKQLAEVRAKLTELRRNKVAADDSNNRNIIRAPVSGIVDKLAYTTLGGVVPPGTTIMEIIPDHDQLVVMAKLPSTNVDQVREGQKANLRFSAFDGPTTPQIGGIVERISADRHVDERTGAAFYTARVMIPRDQLAKLGGLKLRPGMPVEVFIQTGERTMLSYLTRPLRDQLARAFREH